MPGGRKGRARGSRGERVGEEWKPGGAGGDGGVVVVLVPGR